MTEQNITPAVSEDLLKVFLQQVINYIRQRPVIIDPERVRNSDLAFRPCLSSPCQVKGAGNCPDQNLYSPSCDRCEHAQATMETAIKLAPKYGFMAINDLGGKLKNIQI